METMSYAHFAEKAGTFAERLFDAIHQLSADPVAGVTRQGYSDTESKVLARLTEFGAELGMSAETDAAGNVWLTLPGQNRSLPAFVIGSHADSVPQGGHYDGLAGIVAGFLVVHYLKENNFKMDRDVRILMMRCEESSFFGKAYVGSLGMMGRLTADDLSLKHRTLDRTLDDFMKDVGVDTSRLTTGKPVIDISRIDAFVELHIEQGPLLDGLLPARCGVVTGIRGNIRHKVVKCHGQTAHSGALNKEFRHDAVMATAALISRMEVEWQKFLDAGRDLVFTIGVLNTAPTAAISVIPGLTSFTVDMRSLDNGTVKEFHELLLRVAKEEAEKRGVTFEFDRTIVSEAGHVNVELSDRLMKAAEKGNIPCVRIPSGAGHDTAVLSRAGIPCAMIFVANQNGSHNPHEALKMDDLLQGCFVLLHAVLDECK